MRNIRVFHIIILVVGLCIILAAAASFSMRSIEHLQDYIYDKDQDIEYHLPANVIAGESTTGKGIWVKDPRTGNVIYQLWSDVRNRTLYYPPGQYKYGDSIFVPTYEESVYLSTKT